MKACFDSILEGLKCLILTVHIDLKQTVAQMSKNTADHVIQKVQSTISQFFTQYSFFLICVFSSLLDLVCSGSELTP